jgi:hypothetical protein
MKKVSEMSKEEFIEYRIKEKSCDEKEVKTLWEEFEKGFIEKGCAGQDLIDRTKRRLTSYYIQIDKNPAEEFEGILVGMKESDFGARAQFIKATEAFKENPQKAIENGLVTVDGKPLSQSGIAKGSPINIESSTQRGFIGLFKRKNDMNYIIGELISRGQNFDKIPPMFSLIKFRASVSKKTSVVKYVLNATTVTNYQFIKELTDEEVELMLTTEFKEHLLSFDGLQEFMDINKDNWDRMAILKGDVYQLIDDSNRTKVDEATGKTVIKNTMLGINKKDSDETIVCYGNSIFPFNFQDIAQDIIVIGQPRQNQSTKEITMALYGVYAPRKFRVEKSTTKYVEPVLKKEELVAKDENTW